MILGGMYLVIKPKQRQGIWAERQCGISCVKMLLEGRGDTTPLAELTRQGVELKGYDTTTDRGWYYKPLAVLLQSYGITCRPVGYLPLSILAWHLYPKQPAIISVNPQIIRGDETVTTRHKGGHLVVALGFRMRHGSIDGIIIHNPSGKSPAMQQHAFIPLRQFVAAYGERGIVAERSYEAHRQ